MYSTLEEFYASLSAGNLPGYGYKASNVKSKKPLSESVNNSMNKSVNNPVAKSIANQVAKSIANRLIFIMDSPSFCLIDCNNFNYGAFL